VKCLKKKGSSSRNQRKLHRQVEVGENLKKEKIAFKSLTNGCKAKGLLGNEGRRRRFIGQKRENFYHVTSREGARVFICYLSNTCREKRRRHSPQGSMERGGGGGGGKTDRSSRETGKRVKDTFKVVPLQKGGSRRGIW